MSLFLKLTYLFFIGAVLGWVIELLFRRFISSKNPERKWINPGFCVGPYVPLYGFGLCTMYLLASIDARLSAGSSWGAVLVILMMAVAMTALEFLAGLLVLKVSHLRFWDYSHEWRNIMGLICPKFSLIWAACSAGYYFLVHPYILDAIEWLSENLAFSFVIGMFFGIFLIDVAYSSQLVVKLRQFAIENDVVVRYETLKAQIRHRQDEAREKVHFLFPFKSELHISEHLRAAHEAIETRKPRKR
ncbi:MAG: putative ABC transporter permease [Parasporobacterium sp.]|nr:putative ABC transporter permease [Parasporobacterium sp.]